MVKTSPLYFIVLCTIHTSFGIIVPAKGKQAAWFLVNRFAAEKASFYSTMKLQEIDAAERKLLKDLKGMLGTRFTHEAHAFFEEKHMQALRDSYVLERLTFDDITALVRAFK